jgi:predicted DNA repair protein MutK
MSGGSLLLLLDDIAALLDDVSVMSKVAAKKTAGVLGDDLAVNAEKVTGVRADRELPVVWAVARGSLVNKCILVPLAMLIAAFADWLITPLLVLGGLYLCYEGGEKVWEVLFHTRDERAVQRVERLAPLRDPAVDARSLERDKIRGAVRTDFILSAEIIVITLGVVAGESLATRAGVLTAIALIMTVGVYGLVAAIVKLDDLGLYLAGEPPHEARLSAPLRLLGRALLAFAPRLMQTLSVVGTLAMFLVGGGILLHAAPSIEHAIDAWLGGVLAGVWKLLASTLVSGLLGLLAGWLVLGILSLGKRMTTGAGRPG